MKNIFVKLILILFILPQLGFSQDNLANAPEYEINRIYPPVSITKEKLNNVQTLIDINPNYESSWIREYISVEILAICKESIKKVVSKNDSLSQSQKDIMNMADLGSVISVVVQYIPENTLTHNDIKEIEFSFVVDPEHDAKYSGGHRQLKRYLKEKIIDKIPDTTFKNYELAAVKFMVDEDGQIIDPALFWSSNNEKVDELLVDAICNMPIWEPAEYANGEKIKQEFALTVGNMKSCVVNLLNIRKH